MADLGEVAFVNLVSGPFGDRLGQLLEARAALVLRPPVRGSAFLRAAGPAAERLDRWYAESAAVERPAVVLLRHEEGVPELIAGLDADFVILVSDPAEAAFYASSGAVTSFTDGSPERVAEDVASSFGLVQAPASEPRSEEIIDPFELLAGAKPITRPPAQLEIAAEPDLSRRALFPPAAGPGFHMLRLFRKLGPPRREPDLTLGHAVIARRPLVISVVSRKGGVGKTATAAGLAAVLGGGVDGLGHTAALVDANIGNPDAWGRMEVAGAAPTVREINDRILRGEAPPTPVYADTPALAVYPEDRTSGEGYTPAQIGRLAIYLTARHAALVVDLPNRLPAFNSAEAAVAAAWIGLSDVVVLPATGDPAALLGAFEYLETETMAGKRAVVAYIVPKLREIRDAAEVRALLARIEARGAAIVQVPDDDRATLALVRKISITSASQELQAAYRRVAAAIIEAVPVKERTEC